MNLVLLWPMCLISYLLFLRRALLKASSQWEVQEHILIGNAGHR